MTHGDPKRRGRHGDAGLKIGRDTMKPILNFVDIAIKEKKPFLLWYAPFLPHTPHNPPEKYLSKYTVEGRATDVAKYYAMCEWFDETCGTLINTIKNKGLQDNTMFIYICDNGWAAKSTNNQDPNQKQWGGYALRSKGSPYELGIRTPIMVSWPGKIKSGKSMDLAHAIDIFPTIMSAVGLKTPDNLPGINLLDSKKREQRKTVFGVTHSIYNMTPHQPDQTTQYLWCIQNQWKLLLRYPGLDTTRYSKVHDWDQAKVQLYNIEDDPNEKVELSQQYPDIVIQLKKEIHDWHHIDPKIFSEISKN
jgi:arylsulfatase A-like enzyme